MAIVPVCLMITAALSVYPDRSVFFFYETVTLSCAMPGNISFWTVKRNTSTKSSVSCKIGGQIHGSSCTIKGVYPSDSGVYWCESESGCSNTINITVSTGVILESPAAPQTKGANVALKCSYKEKYAKESTSNFSAAFYQNGTFYEKKSEGQMILENLSKKSHEGFYTCKHPTEGESPKVWLAVREDDDDKDAAEPTTAPVPTPPLIRKVLSVILLCILCIVVLVLAVCTCRKLDQARTEAKRKDPDHLRPSEEEEQS